MRDRDVIVGVWIVVDAVAVGLDGDGDGGIVGRAAWINDRVVETVFADEIRWRRVSERSIRSNLDGSALIGLNDNRIGNCFAGRWVDDVDHVTVGVAVVAQQVAHYVLIDERCHVVITGDRWRVVWIGRGIDHVNGQRAFDAVARFITDFDRHGVFANEVGRWRVGVRSIWVQFDRAAVVGRQCQ